MNESSGQVEGQAASDTPPAENASAETSPAEFGELPAIGAGGDGQLNLDLIMDVNLSLTLEVGRTKISVRNLLALTQGSVVELDKLAGEPLDVLVNGTLVAHGEVVTVNEKFGIRLLDVVSAEKRVESLKE
ncbi:MAG: flagellar motor switch protein FliN [Gammaproteobacteria bacterium]